MSALRLAIGALLLAGCLSTRPEQWTHAPDELTAAKTAIEVCRDRVNLELWRAARFGGAIVPLVALFAARGQFNACMDAQGWHQD